MRKSICNKSISTCLYTKSVFCIHKVKRILLLTQMYRFYLRCTCTCIRCLFALINRCLINVTIQEIPFILKNTYKVFCQWMYIIKVKYRVFIGRQIPFKMFFLKHLFINYHMHSHACRPLNKQRLTHYCRRKSMFSICLSRNKVLGQWIVPQFLNLLPKIYCICDNAYHKQEPCFPLFKLGQIVILP